MVSDYQVYINQEKYVESCFNRIPALIQKSWFLVKKNQGKPYSSRYSKENNQKKHQ